MHDRKRRLEFRCEACGFGARRSAAPARCPMCGSAVWKLISTRPHELGYELRRADLVTRPVEVAATR